MCCPGRETFVNKKTAAMYAPPPRISLTNVLQRGNDSRSRFLRFGFGVKVSGLVECHESRYRQRQDLLLLCDSQAKSRMVQKSMSLTYEPSSELLHISAI